MNIKVVYLGSEKKDIYSLVTLSLFIINETGKASVLLDVPDLSFIKCMPSLSSEIIAVYVKLYLIYCYKTKTKRSPYYIASFLSSLRMTFWEITLKRSN